LPLLRISRNNLRSEKVVETAEVYNEFFAFLSNLIEILCWLALNLRFLGLVAIIVIVAILL